MGGEEARDSGRALFEGTEKIMTAVRGNGNVLRE
jgi:hypothetical protein